MSWANDKETILTALSGYREIPNTYNIDERPQSYSHKAYVLRPIGVDQVEVTSNAILSSTLVRLEVIYNNSSGLDDNFDLFNSLYDNIKALPEFNGFESFEFSRDDPKHSIGVMEFYYGFRSC